jgi:hypothetical protein
MKTAAKFFMFRFAIICLTLAFPRFLVAQGTLNALTYVPYTGGFSPDIIIFNSTGSVGWSFVPTSDLSVTAISSIAPQVSFWLGTSQVIASYNFTGSPANFQTISPLLLSAGQMYSVSTQFTNTTFAIYPLGSGTDSASFSTSSYISQFESYFGLPSNQSGTSSTSLDGGPNFQFQVVPEPNCFELSLLAVGIWIFSRLKVSCLPHGRKTL